MSRDPECAGEGQCHGCMSWCEDCGDVGKVCHDETRGCNAHFCRGCGVGPTPIRDYQCDGCYEQDLAECAEYYMLHATTDAEIARWANRLKQFTGGAT